MAVISKKSLFWATLPDFASIFIQGWWMITKFGLVRNDIIGDLSTKGSCYPNPIWLQIRGPKPEKGYFCCFKVLPQALKSLNTLFLNEYSLDFKIMHFHYQVVNLICLRHFHLLPAVNVCVCVCVCWGGRGGGSKLLNFELERKMYCLWSKETMKPAIIFYCLQIVSIFLYSINVLCFI